MPRPLTVQRILGKFPTPIFRPNGLNLLEGELWVKNDGVTHPQYGGNKVRKLGPLLDLAEQRGVRRIITAGGAGSHHVLATTLFARQRGIRTTAILCPQPWTRHAELTLRCAVAWGLDPVPVGSMAAVPHAMLDRWQSGDLLVPVGGWGVVASSGYQCAATELATQVAAGALPEPDVLVVALGSGGTAAGLLAGLSQNPLQTRVVATSVAIRSRWLARQVVLPLAWHSTRSSGQPATWRSLSDRLCVDTSQLGAGYGAASRATAMATSVGKDIGLDLDQTYTAKAFATALELAGHPAFVSRTADRRHQESWRKSSKQRPFRVLYWHTLAATPLEPLLAEGPTDPALPERVRMLLHGG